MGGSAGVLFVHKDVFVWMCVWAHVCTGMHMRKATFVAGAWRVLVPSLACGAVANITLVVGCSTIVGASMDAMGLDDAVRGRIDRFGTRQELMLGRLWWWHWRCKPCIAVQRPNAWYRCMTRFAGALLTSCESSPDCKTP